MFGAAQTYRKQFIYLCLIILAITFIVGAKYLVINNKPMIERRDLVYNPILQNRENSISVSITQNRSCPDCKQTEPCSGFPRALDPDDWQIVIPEKLFVYSAHLDPSSTNESTIRVLGAVSKDELLNAKRTIYCKIWTFNGESQTPAVYNVNSTQVQRLEHIKKYAYVAAEYICHTSLSPNTLTNTTVQLTEDLQTDASNAMLLHLSFNHGSRRNFTVCLERPLFGNISVDWFIEWMEANVLFGAEEVLIHNLSIPHSLDPYIDFYRRVGLLTVQQWHLVMKSTETHCHLQLTMMHNCLYTFQKYSNYVVFIDLDELIVPRLPADRTWSDMIDRLACVNPEAYGARQLMFDRLLSRVDNTSLVTQDVRMRHIKSTRYRKHSKYIADVRRVRALAIHFPSKRFTRNSCVLPLKIGALHHYRKGRTSVQSLQDDTMLKYGVELKSRIKRTKHQVLETSE